MQSNPITQLSAEAVGTLLSTVTASVDRTLRTPDNYLYLAIPSSATSLGCERAGTTLQQFIGGLTVGTPLTYVQATPELLEVMASRGVYGDRPSNSSGAARPLSHVYYLEVLSNRRLLLKYSQILGSKIIGNMTDAQYEAVIDGLAAGIKAIVEPKVA